MWLFLDGKLNSLANDLLFKYGYAKLAIHCQSNYTQSPKDNLLYKELEEKFNITLFEKKMINLAAYVKDYEPNIHYIFQTPNEPELAAARELFLAESGINISDMLWNMNELIELNIYKKDSTMMKRLYKMLSYYHRNHFLMSIGLRKTPR